MVTTSCDDSFFRRIADQALGDETVAPDRRAAALARTESRVGGRATTTWRNSLRVQHKREEAKRHLLIALEKKPALADAHVALGEIYIAEGDFDRARVHAEFAAACGNPRLLEQMQRHGERLGNW